MSDAGQGVDRTKRHRTVALRGDELTSAVYEYLGRRGHFQIDEGLSDDLNIELVVCLPDGSKMPVLPHRKAEFLWQERP